MAKRRYFGLGLVLGLLAIQCGGDDAQEACSAAISKLRSCDLFSAGETDCNSSDADDACIARCFESATCAELRGYYCDVAPPVAIASCTEACQPQFRCDDGTTVPADYECDIEPDCPDASDEVGCPPGPMVQCDSGEEIPADWKCDGTADCADASDEIGCDSLQGFICANGETVPADWQCDGDEDCSDGTDEQNCPREAQAICQ
jgi:hypothetical protein